MLRSGALDHLLHEVHRKQRSRSLPPVDVILCSGIEAFATNWITVDMLPLIYTTNRQRSCLCN